MVQFWTSIISLLSALPLAFAAFGVTTSGSNLVVDSGAGLVTTSMSTYHMVLEQIMTISLSQSTRQMAISLLWNLIRYSCKIRPSLRNLALDLDLLLSHRLWRITLQWLLSKRAPLYVSSVPIELAFSLIASRFQDALLHRPLWGQHSLHWNICLCWALSWRVALHCSSFQVHSSQRTHSIWGEWRHGDRRFRCLFIGRSNQIQILFQCRSWNVTLHPF